MTPRNKAAAVLLGSACLVACRGPKAPADLGAARTEHARLRARLDVLAREDAVVTEALAQPASAIVALRTPLVQGIVDVVAQRYLDRVELDLPLGARVHESREVKVDTLVGDIVAGTWTLDLVVHRVRGRLRAGKPTLAPATGNQVRLALPVAMDGAQGSATVRFAWDGRAMGALVCRDFEVTRRLDGIVLPEDYPVSGAFRLEAGPAAVRAVPVFPARRFHIRVDLAEASWAAVKDALTEQDRITRCGLAIEPATLIPRLQELLRKGFDVTLPATLFRPVDLPAAVRGTVEVQDTQVELAVQTRGLRVTPRAVWYAADVRSRVAPSAAAAVR
jgi:hypothetical protein